MRLYLYKVPEANEYEAGAIAVLASTQVEAEGMITQAIEQDLAQFNLTTTVVFHSEEPKVRGYNGENWVLKESFAVVQASASVVPRIVLFEHHEG